ncbi:eukaryotic translation initiation factor 3 subunit D-2 [Scaptodrosophila lebanonensis]|uniref:Eukaryotic translation initiation factor 3 subunit D n=1 Tax=Drosophila lebanonensis TaxID=7225 RepID=A0A6J2THL8_DROLE|nr:eukaryotic translation initiation factor 3 subunit D-2 [Scaptodrosophila lebanonensis]
MSQYAPFIKPYVQYNEHGWGPCEVPEMDVPYQPFCKSDRLGKICDWTVGAQDKKFLNKYASTFGNNSQYAYFHEDDDSTFHLVNSARTQKPYQRGRYRPNLRNNTRGRGRNVRGNAGANNNAPGGPNTGTKYGKGRDVRRMVGRRFPRNAPVRLRESSVLVRADWVSIEEIDFPRLLKLTLPNIKEGEDVASCGSLEYYDKMFDRINVKNERTLQKIDRMINVPSTIDDPIIRRLSKSIGNVFATDDILATIMCCTRSNYSWDIVVEKLGTKIFLDKRDSAQFDLLTVNETSLEPPLDEEGSINSPQSLSMEATFINHNFSQQVLRIGDAEQKYKFAEPNPFEEPGVELASVGYRYKQWNLGNDIVLIARCKHNGVIQCPNGELQFLSIKALNEWDSKAANSVEWRQKLDTQRGAVLASELRNNACKLAKWTVEAVLAGSDQLKLGYVSRINPRDHLRHVILGTQQFKPQEFATQINLSLDNAWGVLRCLIDIIMKQADGKYLIMKDPNKPMIRLYDIPDNAFDSDAGEEEESSDDRTYPKTNDN